MAQPESSRVDVQEHGANHQTSARRLYMQLQAFGACDDPKRLTQALERAHVEGVLYADAADPLGVAVLGISEDPGFFVGRWRELLGTEPFLGLRRKPELTISAAFGPLRSRMRLVATVVPCSTRPTALPSSFA